MNQAKLSLVSYIIYIIVIDYQLRLLKSYFGLTAIAVSPSIVSGRVVETTISSQLLVTLEMLY